MKFGCARIYSTVFKKYSETAFKMAKNEVVGGGGKNLVSNHDLLVGFLTVLYKVMLERNKSNIQTHLSHDAAS